MGITRTGTNFCFPISTHAKQPSTAVAQPYIKSQHNRSEQKQRKWKFDNVLFITKKFK